MRPVKPPELFAAVAVGVGAAVEPVVGMGVAVGAFAAVAVGVTPLTTVGVGVGFGLGVGVGGCVGGVHLHTTETEFTDTPRDVPLKIIVSSAQSRPEIVTWTELLGGGYNTPPGGLTGTEADQSMLPYLGVKFEPLNIT